MRSTNEIMNSVHFSNTISSLNIKTKQYEEKNHNKRWVIHKILQWQLSWFEMFISQKMSVITCFQPCLNT